MIQKYLNYPYLLFANRLTKPINADIGKIKDTDVYTVSPMSNQKCAQSSDFI